MLREAAGLSQEAFAHEAGITKNQVQLLEGGRSSGRKEASGPSNPRMSTLDGIARALGLTVPQLLVKADELGAVHDRTVKDLDEYAHEVEDNTWMVTDGHISELP